jgi:hypothetical protein
MLRYLFNSYKVGRSKHRQFSHINIRTNSSPASLQLDLFTSFNQGSNRYR